MGGQVLDYEAKDILRRGIAQGLAKGSLEKLLQLIRKKLTKGLSIEGIADALEESTDYIEQLIHEHQLA